MIPNLRYHGVALSSGAFTGFLAGLVGVGGSELRYPFLLYALRIPVREVIVINLAVALVTSGLNAYLRMISGLITGDALVIGLLMMAGSVFGARSGSIISHKLPESALRRFLAVILIVVVVRLVLEFIPGAEAYPIEMAGPSRFTFAILSGFLIGIISGSLGVAGGEYRIPILTFVLGVPITIAGTVSQLVAIPTVTSGMLKHLRMMDLTRNSLSAIILMGIGSSLGVIFSMGILLEEYAEEVVKIVFVLILSYTVFRLLRE